MSRYLIITEDTNTEIDIFEEVLKNYGFKVLTKKERINSESLSNFTQTIYEDKTIDIVIAAGPRSRIHSLVRDFDSNTESIERAFGFFAETFSGIFLIYDVDHNDDDDIKEAFSKFNEPSKGLLLLSSPCIEVLGDYDRNRKELYCKHLKEYKSDLNKHHDKVNKCSCAKYIADHFNELALYYLDKNTNEYKKKNVVLHPEIIIDYIAKYNERHNDLDKEKCYVKYHYFSTVVYVLIAYIKNLVAQIDNYILVKTFLNSK